MNKTLSIVIPTYNMENYLDKCLKSLLIHDEKLMKLLEVLVVNDGSRDKSSEIAHSYEKKYPETFRVIDKENGNYGSCINRGLKEATGKYIKVLDADDSFEKDNFPNFLFKLQEVDVDVFLTDYITVDSNYRRIRKISYDMLPKETPFAFVDEQKHLFRVQMHAIAYRTQMLKDINYLQTEGISYTDQEWTCIGLSLAKSMYYYPHILYRYLVERIGRTMSSEQFNKAAPQWLIIGQKLLEYKKQYKVNSPFVNFRIYDLFYHVYQQFFYSDVLNNTVMKDIDDLIKNQDVNLYQQLGETRYFTVKEISRWRDNNYRKSYSFRVIVFLVKQKRKYFPWLELSKFLQIKY